MSITEEQKKIVKSTAPILKENGKEITSIFYKHLFEVHPELLNFFNQTNQKQGTQPLALANIIYFAAENIDHLEVLMPEVQIVAHKHRSLTVQPEHYPIVGKFMLKAIAEVLGEKATPEILDAWSTAYAIIADIFIVTERKLYDELGNNEIDKGFIPFTIVKKEKISDGPIYSFEIKRSDGKKLIDYHSGQYITLRIKKNGLFHNRHYGLVRPFDGKIYRVGIKQVNNCEPKGILSSELIENYHEGDTILASLPAGTFSIVNDAKHHLFIAGGVGITVLSTMIETLYKEGKSHMVTLIHCVPGKEQAAYTNRMRMCVLEKQYHVLYQGRYLLKELIKKTLTPETHVYLCGATPFMNTVEDHLEECEIPSSHIHMNAFRPSLSMIRNAVKDQSTTRSL
jgi:nitric oxide dioxygenase